MQQKNILKIDLILLKSFQPNKNHKFWEKKIAKFEEDYNLMIEKYV